MDSPSLPPPYPEATRRSERAVTTAPSSWAARYGGKHRWVRLAAFPAGLAGPKKVRVYQRDAHYLLNWWDPAEKKNLSERVDGDLLTALVRAREIDDRVLAVRTAGAGKGRRCTHSELVDAFLRDLGRRADAGEVDVCTPARYRTALGHYLAYAGQPAVTKRYPTAARADRDFRLGLAAFLADRRVPPNGRGGAAARPMRGQPFVLDAVRAAYAWAADPDRGGLLPHGFRNPFLRAGGKAAVFKGDPLAPPDVTAAMVVAFVRGCDLFQLKLFVPMILFGLRAAEPCHLLRADLTADGLAVPCRPDLGVWTKGRRDKRFPLVPELARLWTFLATSPGPLLYRRRQAAGDTPSAGPSPKDENQLVAEYRRRCAGLASAGDRARVRDELFRACGGLTYDDIESEFRSLAGRLGWPRAASLKDLRHLFATAMNNAGVPEGYRRYLLGHAPGGAATVAYTHLNELRRHYLTAVRAEYADVMNAVLARLDEISPPAAAEHP